MPGQQYVVCDSMIVVGCSLPLVQVSYKTMKQYICGVCPDCSEFLQIVESHKLFDKNVLALAYCKELNWVLAAGVEGVIKVISLARPQNRDEVEPLPTELNGHTDKVTALVVLKNYVAASGGHDRQIRFWDLHTMVRYSVRYSGIRTCGKCFEVSYWR